MVTRSPSIRQPSCWQSDWQLSRLALVWLVVRRADATAKDPVAPAVALAVAGIVTAPILSWLAIPQVLAGGALMLGNDLLGTGRRRVGYAVIATATLTLLLGVLATAIPPVDNND
jgi:hypothetical protein